MCVYLRLDENIRGEVTFSWVNGMSAISFKSFRDEPQQQNNYVTPGRQRRGVELCLLLLGQPGMTCQETTALTPH